MGVTRTKLTVECDCGCDYGNNCGKKNVYLFCYNRSVDIGSLYIDGKLAFCLTDNGLAAVRKVMLADEVFGPKEELTEEEKKLL